MTMRSLTACFYLVHILSKLAPSNALLENVPFLLKICPRHSSISSNQNGFIAGTLPTATSSVSSTFESRRLGSSALHRAFFADDDTPKNKNKLTQLANSNIAKTSNANASSSSSSSNNNEELLQSLQLKDEALRTAQTAVTSLESALDSTVTKLETMQQQLQLQVTSLEEGLKTSRQELTWAKVDLDGARGELKKALEDLQEQREENESLREELGEVRGQLSRAEERVEELEELLAKVEEDVVMASPGRKKESNPWNIWTPPVPTLNDWVIIKGSTEGEIQISGKVTNHADIPDGDAIVTSPLRDSSQAVERKIVTTFSGSQYRLGRPMQMPESTGAGSGVNSSGSSGRSENAGDDNATIAKSGSIAIPDLTGETLGNGRYLLSGSATPSVNGRSFIQTGYRANPAGNPMGDAIVIKVSANKDAMKREFANYQKVSASLKKGSFIRRHEFLPVAGKEIPDKSALVMQRGIADVKAFMPTVGGRLEGELLHDCALSALRCVEALHAARLVWNDLKTENFVVVEDKKTGGVFFRGIDLESCMPVKSIPVDYTPEACPPEFATSFMNGEAGSFQLEYSYDVWSYGMFLYEIGTGRGFFDGMSPQKITQALPTFEPNVEKITDSDLADLIVQCLSPNPKDRPSFVRISKHPFLTANPSASRPPSFFDLFQI